MRKPFTRALAQLRAAVAESGRSVSELWPARERPRARRRGNDRGAPVHEQLSQRISDVLAQLQQLRDDVEQLA
jgi:hypothetical protein